MLTVCIACTCMFWIHGMFLMQEGLFYTGLNKKISFKDKFYELSCWVRYLKIYLKVYFLFFNIKTTFISMSSAGDLLMQERLISEQPYFGYWSNTFTLQFYDLFFFILVYVYLPFFTLFVYVHLLHLITSVLFLNLILKLILNHYAKILVFLLIRLSSPDCYL